eukprot:jgi/Bigna1/74877/fgenesh1_pg.31_\
MARIETLLLIISINAFAIDHPSQSQNVLTPPRLKKNKHISHAHRNASTANLKIVNWEGLNRNGRFPPRESQLAVCCQTYKCTNGEDCRQYVAPVTQNEWEGEESITGAHSGVNVTEEPTQMRAISVAMLEKVLKFMEDLTEIDTATLSKRTYEGPEETSIMPGCGNRLQDNKLKALCTQTGMLHIDCVTMHEVNGYLVTPATAISGKSFVTHFGGGGRPTYFVSHNWSGRFKPFVKAVLAHFRRKGHKAAEKESTFYWVCTFANNQWALDLEKPPVTLTLTPSPNPNPNPNPNYNPKDESPFALAINTVITEGQKEILAIQDDIQQPDRLTLSRAWCAYELNYGLREGADIVFGCDDGVFLDKTSTTTGCADPWRKLACQLDLTTAFAQRDDWEVIVNSIAEEQNSVCTVKEKEERMENAVCLRNRMREIIQCSGEDPSPTDDESSAARQGTTWYEKDSKWQHGLPASTEDEPIAEAQLPS